MTRHLIILNPISGRGLGAQSVSEIKRILTESNIDFDLVQTEKRWHAGELAHKAVGDGYAVVVAASGDGTANEVLNGLMNAKREGIGEAAMGFIGVGSGNDFGAAFNIPHGVEIGCKILTDAHRRRVDVGFAKGGDYPGGRYFGNGVGVGFDAVGGFVAEESDMTGLVGYLIAALKTMFIYFKAPLLEIKFNDEIIQQKALMVSIMNGRRMGGGFWMTPTSEVDDQVFDVCIVDEVSKPKVFYLIMKFMSGSQVGHPNVRMAQTKNIHVRALEGSTIPAHSDGETLCKEGQEIEVEILPAQIDMICPPREMS